MIVQEFAGSVSELVLEKLELLISEMVTSWGVTRSRNLTQIWFETEASVA